MKLLLIGGAQRSGTTLLQTLIANALNAPVLPETHILCDILTAYKRAKEYWKKTQRFYGTEDELYAFFRLFALRHLDDIAKSTSPQSVLVLKDPNFVHVRDEITAIFSDAIYIVCVRDPRDIAASFLQIGNRLSEQDASSKYRKRDVRFISKKIMSVYLNLLQSPQRENVVLARYEEITSSPREALQALARKTGLELSPDRIEAPEWLCADLRHDPAWITELEGQKPSPAHVGAFKQVMQPDEVALVEEICAPLMRWLGYELSGVGLPTDERLPAKKDKERTYLQRIKSRLGLRRPSTNGR